MPTTRPRRDAHRDQVATAAADIAQAIGLRPVLKAALAELQADLATYLAARTLEKTAAVKLIAAKKDVAVVDRAFNRALRTWAATVRDEDGKAAPGSVAPLLDDILPGALVRRTPREKVTRTSDLAAQVAQDREVAGDADRLQQLIDARVELEREVAAREAIEAQLKSAKKALRAVQPAFDRAWGVVAREALKGTSEIAAMVPRFRRARRGERDHETTT